MPTADVGFPVIATMAATVVVVGFFKRREIGGNLSSLSLGLSTKSKAFPRVGISSQKSHAILGYDTAA